MKGKIIKILISIFLIFSNVYSWTTGQFSDPNFLKGITFADWSTNGFKSANAWNSLSKLHETGATWVSIVPTWYMDNSSSTLIYYHPTKSASDEALKQVIDWAKMLGLKIMLKPHIDVLDGTWRGQINPSSWTSWFDVSGNTGTTSGGYKNFIMHYAKIAQEKGVDLFCIGTELRTATINSGNNAMWQNVINSIKGIYTGQLTYAANGSNYYESDEFLDSNLDNVIWPGVDILGVDVYFPLTNSIEPSVDALYNAWTNNKDGKNLIQLLTNLKNKYSNKNLICTEIGYRSYGGANIQPFDLGTHTNYSGVEQENCYEAAFRKLSEQNIIHGTFWWDWEIDPDGGGVGNTWYMPQNKPAEQILKNWYGATPVPTVTPSPTAYIPDTALYHYEGGDLMGWQKETSIGPQTQSIANTTLYSYHGDHSVAMDVTFAAGTYQKGAMMIPGISPANGTASAYILAPLSAPETIAKFFINDANWNYFESSYVNLIPGVWTQLTWNLTGMGTTIATPVQRFGVIVQSAGDYKAYDGYYYIDSIDVPGVPTPEPTSTPNASDPTLYPFEDGTTMGWNTIGGQITGSSNSSTQAYWGVRSLAVACNFTTDEGGNVGTQSPSITDLSGKTIVARVYVPIDFPTFGGGYIYIKSGNSWVWENGPWTNFTAGAWNTIYLDVDHPDWSATGTPDHTNIKEIGVKIAPPGSWSGSFIGTCFIDSVDVFSGAGTPTLTPTKTNTIAATNTPTSTKTNTPTNTGTNTITNTATNTVTNTGTSTRTNTTTNTLTNTQTWTTTATATDTATRTETVTGTQPPTWTSTNTGTNTPTFSETASSTNTATNTATNTNTGIATQTFTYTFTFTQISTNTPTFTNTQQPTNTATAIQTGGADNSLYPFEDGTKMGWEVYGDEIIASAFDNTKHYLGIGSLKVSCNFTSDTGGNVGTQEPLVTNLTGATLKARVYVPLDFPTNGGGYIYIKSGAWVWQNGDWANFIPGTWTELSFDLNNPAYSAPGIPDHSQIKEIGVKIAPPGGYTGSWSGDVYIDTVEVLGIAPTPTPGIDTATYPFEDGTTMGWDTVGDGIVGSANATNRYYRGVRSLTAFCTFTSSTGGNIGTQSPVANDLRGATITAYVYIPWDLPKYSGGYIYIKSGALWTWENAVWKNMERGKWNLISYYVDAINPDHADVKEIGIKVAPPGGFTGTWIGAIYIDSVNIEGITIPTVTPTFTFTQINTPTWTATATHTATRTETVTGTQPPTWTPTNTGTNTPTHTITNTQIVTETFTATRTNTQTATQTFTPTFTATFSNTPTGTVIAQPTVTPTESGELKFVNGSPLNVFPNPNSGKKFAVKFSVTKKANNIILRIYTVAGRLIKEINQKRQINAGENILWLDDGTLNDLAKGTYFYVIIIKDEQAREVKSKIEKFIVIK